MEPELSESKRTNNSHESGNSSLANAVFRILRHEVGDLLQSVYSTAALLNQRIPPELTVERQIVSDLRRRSDLCRKVLDDVSELLGTPHLEFEPVELTALAKNTAESVATQFPDLTLEVLETDPCVCWGDARALRKVLVQLLCLAHDRGAKRCQIQTASDARSVRLNLEAEPVETPALEWPALWGSGSSIGNAQMRLGMMLALHLVEAQSGHLTVAERSNRGVRVTLELPRSPADAVKPAHPPGGIVNSFSVSK